MAEFTQGKVAVSIVNLDKVRVRPVVRSEEPLPRQLCRCFARRSHCQIVGKKNQAATRTS